MSRQRRRVDVSCDPSMMNALRHGTWMDEEKFTKTRIKGERKGGGIYQPFYGKRVTDFIPRQDAGKFMLGKYLIDRKFPHKYPQRLFVHFPT